MFIILKKSSVYVSSSARVLIIQRTDRLQPRVCPFSVLFYGIFPCLSRFYGSMQLPFIVMVFKIQPVHSLK